MPINSPQKYLHEHAGMCACLGILNLIKLFKISYHNRVFIFMEILFRISPPFSHLSECLPMGLHTVCAFWKLSTVPYESSLTRPSSQPSSIL